MNVDVEAIVDLDVDLVPDLLREHRDHAGHLGWSRRSRSMRKGQPWTTMESTSNLAVNVKVPVNVIVDDKVEDVRNRARPSGATALHCRR